MGTMLDHLIKIKAIRGRDYTIQRGDYVILHPTPLIKGDSKCYKHEFHNVSPSHSYIGRVVDPSTRTVRDYVFDRTIARCTNPYIGPWTIGWTYDYNYVSVINGIMKLVESIPLNKRHDRLFVITYLCSRIDGCNDPVNGIIEGKWEPTFSGGREPLSWKNSRDVFRERSELNRAVKYGQCWVLGDLLTGILNFLGIEARTVKVQPCIMDTNIKGGIDYCLDSEGVRTKGNGDPIDPMGMGLNPSQGLVYSADPDSTKDKNAYYDLDYFALENINGSWNYHVWTEAKIKDSWYILDPSPLHGVGDSVGAAGGVEDPPRVAPGTFKTGGVIHHPFPPYSENRYHPLLQGLKYFGPININNIVKNKRPRYIPHNFDYISACLNGQTRIWKPLISESCGTVLYLDDIIYNSVNVYQRDAYGNTVCVTERYRSSYDDRHINNPIYISKAGTSPNGLASLYVLVRDNVKSNYVVQLSLFIGDTLVYMYRKKMISISYDELNFFKVSHLKKYRLKATRLTLVIYDIGRNIFWAQCLKR